jgi:starch synthase
MKVALSTIGRFHTFDLARELYRHNTLAGIWSGYPRFKLRGEGLPQELIHTFPWVHGPYVAFKWKAYLSQRVVHHWENFNAVTFARWVRHALSACDVYVGLSGSGLPAGRVAKARGARYVCDRGSSHIRTQDELLREEHEIWGIQFGGIDARAIEREEAEYAEADCITVPSTFSFNSFLSKGVPQEKLRRLSYGVNLTRFQPVATPPQGRFDVVFVGGMSLQKGVQYLVQAYQRIEHPAKSLTFVGATSPTLIATLASKGMWPSDARVLGHIAQDELKNILSRSHVKVLPSVQDGFGMVMAQAMACGCPVIASSNTGACDLFEDGNQGFIVPIRNVDALASRMQQMADRPVQRDEMGRRALEKVNSIAGWSDYGKQAMSIYQELL